MYYLLHLSMYDWPSTLQVKLLVVDTTIHSESNKFATGIANKNIGDSKLYDNPDASGSYTPDRFNLV